MAFQLPGFTSAAGLGTQHRLIVGLSGLEKRGKTHFALTAPGPIAILSLDIGLEGVVEKAIARGTDVVYAEFEVKQEQAEAKVEWDRFEACYTAALAKARTVIIDTASEVWELLRMAKLGKLAQVPPMKYAECNAAYRKVVRAAYDKSAANLILLHKVKPVWADNPTTGKSSKVPGEYERAGYGDTGFLVQVNATCFRDADGFGLRVDDCRQNMNIAGMEMRDLPDLGMPLSFAGLATQVFPETTLEDWA